VYSKGGELEKFAGRDITYSLAKNSLTDVKDEYNMDEFNEEELSNINKWENYYKGKYKIVGILKKE
jgi:hypothetical protein